jgi:positive regulator of sigma E activity
MAWELLFGSDIGLLSLFTIVFIIVMAFFMVRFYMKQAEHDRQQQQK